MLVTVGGVQFSGDAGDVRFTIGGDGLKGWLDGVDMRNESIPRPSAHGEFDVPGFLGGRIVSITGLIRATSAADFEDALEELSGLLSDGSSEEMEVQQNTRTLTAMVRRHGAPDVISIVYGALARYRIQFWAPDPRRYGASNTDGPSSSISVNHAGNFPATSVLTVAGSSGGGYTITGPGGRQITVTEPLVSGTPHTLDLATGALVVDGDRIIGGITVYEPWTVPVGASVSVSVSAGTVTAVTRDTFV